MREKKRLTLSVDPLTDDGSSTRGTRSRVTCKREGMSVIRSRNPGNEGRTGSLAGSRFPNRIIRSIVVRC